MTIDTSRIRRGDCVALMQGMDANSVDFTVTSTPYDDLHDYKGYAFKFEDVAARLYRITKPGGVVVWVPKTFSPLMDKIAGGK